MRRSVLKYFYLFILGISASAFGQSYSLNFDGADDYVFIGDNPSLDLISEEFTFLATVKFSETSPQGYILSKRYYFATISYKHINQIGIIIFWFYYYFY